MPDSNETVDWETRRKRVIHRAHYRGFKEADLILSGFARANGADFTHEDIAAFEHLLGAKDHDIYAWVTRTMPVPTDYDTPLLERLRAFRPVF